MTFDEDADPFDPIIARRFEALDRVQPPAAAYPPLVDPFDEIDEPAVLASFDDEQPSMDPVVLGSPFDRPAHRSGGIRPLPILAAAAALVVVAGVALWAVAGREAPVEVEASDSGGDQPAATADGSDERRTLEVVTPEETVTTDDGAPGSPSGQAVDADDGTDGAEAGAAPGQDGEEADEPSAVTTGSTEAPDSTGTTADSSPETTTTRPAETTGPTEPAPSTTTSWTLKGNADKPFIVRGMVTEVFTDCMSRLVLNEAGEVESVGPVSCDGGSYIIVNGNRIQTSSGFVAEDDYYDKHLRDLQPGQTVTVTVVPSGPDAALLTLDCPNCRIDLGG